MEFPLKPDFFPLVRLNPAEATAYSSRAEGTARALLKVLRDPHWRQIAAPSRGVALAKMLCIDVDDDSSSGSASASNNRDENAAKASACLLVCGTALAAGSVREVVEAIGASDATEYRSGMAFLHESRFLDAVTLSSVGSVEDQQVATTTTVKWAAFRSDGRRSSASGASASAPSSLSSSSTPVATTSSVVEGTDYCFLEHVGILTDDDEGESNPTSLGKDSPKRLQRKPTRQSLSKDVGFVVQESIERAREVPSLAGFGLERGELRRAGTLVLPTSRPGIVQVSSVLQLRLASSSGRRQSVVERQLLRRVASVSRVELLLERRRLARVQLVPRASWIADERRRSCAVCVKPFALRRRKHHCRACGEVVCASCAPQREACVDQDTGGSARVCTKCLVQARRGLCVGITSTEAVAPTPVEEVVVSAPLSPSSPLVSSLTVSHKDVKRSEPRSTTAVDRRPYSRKSSASSDESNFSIAMRDSVMSIRECGWVNDAKQELKSSHGVSRVPSRFAGVRGAVSHHVNSFVPCPDLASSPSSESSSSVSLSDLDAFEDLIAINSSPSPAVVTDTDSRQESIDNVLENIRRMKVDLSALSTAYRTDQSTASSRQPTPAAVSPIRSSLSANVPTTTSRTSVDVDYISSSDDFNLLSPESLTLSREQSTSQQDAGEKSRRSNFSSFTVSTILDADDYEQDDDVSDDDDDVSDYDDDYLDEDLEVERGVRERSNSQTQLLALRRQVEGLHRSLALATTKLQSFEALSMGERPSSSGSNQRRRSGSRRSSRQSIRRSQRELDPQVSRTYEALVAELHELMGLPIPASRPTLSHVA